MMEGYTCRNKGCNTELHYEQIQSAGIRVKKDNPETGKLEFHVYCPTCDEYYWTNK